MMGHETGVASTASVPILQAVAANGTTEATTMTALAPGFRFNPTPEELISYYLKCKVSKKPVAFDAIGEVDIYKHEPWDLAGFSRLKTRDQQWYFYHALDKYGYRATRMKRSTTGGYWKATGTEKEVRQDSQLIGKKKILVFYIGRNPNGLRTNWVMHEFRLVDAELAKYGIHQDAYLLCKIFQKDEIRQARGNQYAPFIEEEWDDVPGVDAVDEVAPSDDANNERNNVEQLQDTRSIYKDPLSVNNEPPIETQNLLPVNNEPPIETPKRLPVCKGDRVEDVTPICVPNTQAPVALPQYKRRRHNKKGSNRSNALENSTRTTQDLFSSTTKTPATTTTTASTSMASASKMPISALLEFSLMESLEPEESPCVRQPTFDTANLDLSVPPSIVKFINDLQKEVHKISFERENLKLELMSAHSMINILQSQIDFLINENKDLKRRLGDRDAK